MGITISGNICASVNEEIVLVPGSRAIRDGDIVSIDRLIYEGFIGIPRFVIAYTIQTRGL